ncbi:pyruvate kinase 2, cytosolic-like [Telopea speciosissima]|uniref:pyruvate kinase 2, cytosolic-like n=1 Tax=Telopea speciosissima TaxID=54955 RepID=UPI001CC642AE|nr:pyruvate kinase 2, cytosolic-like [Telopea speciosissima]
MHSTHLLLEEPIRMATILEPSRTSFFPAMTKIVGTLGSKSRSVEVISGCLKAGMSVARFDFSLNDCDYHQETLENLKIAVKSTKKLCAVMLDTVGPELQVVNKSEHSILLQENAYVVLTPDQDKEATSELLPINFSGLSKVSNDIHEHAIFSFCWFLGFEGVLSIFVCSHSANFIENQGWENIKLITKFCQLSYSFIVFLLL